MKLLVSTLSLLFLTVSPSLVFAEDITWEISCEYSEPIPVLFTPIFAGTSITLEFFINAYGTIKLISPSNVTSVVNVASIEPNGISEVFVLDEIGRYRVEETYTLVIDGIGVVQSFTEDHVWYHDNPMPGTVLFRMNNMYIDSYVTDIVPADVVSVKISSVGKPGNSVKVKLVLLKDIEAGERPIDLLYFSTLWHKNSFITNTGIAIRAFCPVDLIVTDPAGGIVSKYESTIPSATYIESDLNGDDDADDEVFIADALAGVYLIQVQPEPDAELTQTYTLEVCYGNRVLKLGDSEIQDIPMEPYSFFYFPHLIQGRNLVSLPVQPVDTSIDSVLYSIAGKYDSIWRYDPIQGWLQYLPDAPETSNLWTMEPGVGYWLVMKEPWPLLVQGSQSTEAVPLRTGWNLVGYNSRIPRNISDCILDIEGKYFLVSGYDPDRGWLWHIPASPEASSLLYMNPGSGYWIQATENCLWNVGY